MSEIQANPVTSESAIPQEPVDVTALAPGMQPLELVELEPIDYSHLTTDELCTEWLAIPPDDLRRQERLEEIARCLTGKVDSMDEIQAKSLANAAGYASEAAAYHARYVEPLEAKASESRRRAAGIEAILLYVMKKKDLPELPGTKVRAVFKANTSNPASEWKREPTAADAARYGETFVRFVPHHYEWENKNVKQAVMDGSLKNFDALVLKPKESVKFEALVDSHAIPPKRKRKPKTKEPV